MIKQLILLITLMVVPLSNYSKENTFLNNVKNAYSKYQIIDCSSSAGIFYVVVGEVNNKTSFSIYFENEMANTYNVVIYEDDTPYILSNYDDFQIYYNIKVNENKKYFVSLVSKEVDTPYYSYSLKFEYNEIGDGRNNFPYNTKLKNEISKFKIILISLIIIVLVELLVLIYFTKKKKKTNTYVVDNMVYEVIDDEEK